MASKYLDYNGLDYFWDQVKSYVATSIIGKANDSDVVHKSGDETVAGAKTFDDTVIVKNYIFTKDNLGSLAVCGGKSLGNAHGSKAVFYGSSYSNTALASAFALYTGAPQKIFAGYPDGTLTWNGADVTGDAHLAGTETFTGAKYFSGGLYSLGANIHCVKNDYDFSDLSTSYQNTYYKFKDSTMLDVAAMQSHVRNNQFGLRFLMRKIGDATTAIQDSFGVALWYYTSSGSAYFLPTNKALVTAFGLGAPGIGWSEVFADSATINTSDERLKESIAGFPDEVLDAWGDVGWVQYRMSEAVQRKGAAARLHSGMIAQRAASAFRAHGLDASRYGFFCHDEWEANEEDGVAAGDKYSVRYAEALCIEAAYMRRENARLKERLALLEERVALLPEA